MKAMNSKTNSNGLKSKALIEFTPFRSNFLVIIPIAKATVAPKTSRLKSPLLWSNNTSKKTEIFPLGG